MAVTLLKKTLTGSFQPSGYVLIAGNRLTLDWDIDASGGPTTLQWYMEFASDPITGPWRREIAEEDAGKGVVSMPEVVRTFANNNGTTLADGSYGYSLQFTRQEAFARVQACVTAGAATVVVSCPTGTQPSAPA